jgi:RHS repeat-associated protein
LYYIHTDHLGSTSLMSDADGQKVETSVARYLPYGRWRTEPTADLTDRGYTGHKHNDDLGLIYMNARYYLPGIGRFISADTLVPDPTNPQQFNRYTYVLNNPLRFTDPTGHCAENGDEACWSYAEQISAGYGIPLEFLTLMNLSQMRFFIQGLNDSRGIDNRLPDEIISTINRMHEVSPLWFQDLLTSNGWNVLGIRLEYGNGFVIAGQGDLDIIFNFRSWEFSIMFTPGIQIGMVAGASGGAGVFVGFDAPSNDVYWGSGWGVTFAVADGLGGGIQYNNHIDTWSLVVGGNAGLELDLSVGFGYTFELYRNSSNPYGNTRQASYGVVAPQIHYLRGYLFDILSR